MPRDPARTASPPDGPGTGPAAGTVVLFDTHRDTAMWFERPRDVVTATRLDAVGDALAAAERAVASGAHVAGYLAYEAGFAFEAKLRARSPRLPEVPLVWFGLYDAPETLDVPSALARLAPRAEAKAAAAEVARFDMSEADYLRAFERVRAHLACGDIYQANLTLRARGHLAGTSAALFRRLMTAQPVGHAAFLALEEHSVLSLSPELFLEREGPRIRTRPMKGTAPRGSTPQEDREAAALLREDPKSQAENVMIVDLMRNDLSRIARAGSVTVPTLFEVEPYQTLFQMTSTVEAELAPGTGFADAMAHLFPCGSITGAPKLRAMEILHDLETSPRGLYTGAIGHLAPGGDFRFNVAIRTLVAGADGRFEAGAGSGVVFDSEPRPEYAETRLKLAFLDRRPPDFALFETMAWHRQEGYLLLERHLARLAASAARLGFLMPRRAIEAMLAARAETFSASRRVRLELAADGAFEIADVALSPTPARWRIGVAPTPVDARDPLLAHKTTRRQLYDGTRAAMAAEQGCDEVVFVNADGFVTEGSFTNVFVSKGGRLLTPALPHGLLPGTLRAALLETGRAHEADLTLADLATADRLYFGNSVRGLVDSVIQSRAGSAGS